MCATRMILFFSEPCPPATFDAVFLFKEFRPGCAVDTAGDNDRR